MIRIVAIVCLSSLLVTVLYLPSAYPPERFLDQLREEHHRAEQVWSPDIAQRILDRMLSIHAQANDTPLPFSSDAAAAAASDRPVGQEMAQIQRRVFGSSYFRAIDALLVLASYRVAALLEWLPRCVALALVLTADALLARVIKAKEFQHHNPERFALYVCMAIVTLCASVLALVWPGAVHPVAWAAVPMVVTVLGARSLADYHKRP
jgi:cation transport ATPase